MCNGLAWSTQWALSKEKRMAQKTISFCHCACIMVDNLDNFSFPFLFCNVFLVLLFVCSLLRTEDWTQDVVLAIQALTIELCHQAHFFFFHVIWFDLCARAGERIYTFMCAHEDQRKMPVSWSGTIYCTSLTQGILGLETWLRSSESSPLIQTTRIHSQILHGS